MESIGSLRWIWQAFSGTIKVRKRQSITFPLQPIPEEESWLNRSFEILGALWSIPPFTRLLEFTIYYLRLSLNIAASYFVNLYIIDSHSHMLVICILFRYTCEYVTHVYGIIEVDPPLCYILVFRFFVNFSRLYNAQHSNNVGEKIYQSFVANREEKYVEYTRLRGTVA